MIDLRKTCERLKQLGRRKPTIEARREVEEALRSKWEGMQSAALHALGDWGDRRSVDLLREWLQEAFQRKYGWGIRGVAVKALARCVREEDVPWVLETYFGLRGVLRKHELLWLVMALPVPRARDRLLLEAQSSNRDNRQAAMKAIGNMGLPDKMDLLERFLDDPDAQIRHGARHMLSQLKATAPAAVSRNKRR
jgi:HEAT repeat protein